MLKVYNSQLKFVTSVCGSTGTLSTPRNYKLLCHWWGNHLLEVLVPEKVHPRFEALLCRAMDHHLQLHIQTSIYQYYKTDVVLKIYELNSIVITFRERRTRLLKNCRKIRIWRVCVLKTRCQIRWVPGTPSSRRFLSVLGWTIQYIISAKTLEWWVSTWGLVKLDSLRITLRHLRRNICPKLASEKH